jgi:chromosome partitioning protein
MKVISIAQHKGGTGKTTTTLNLGYGLANAGKKVLLVDMDAQANLTDSLEISESSTIEGKNMYHYMTMKAKNPTPLKVTENLFILPSSIDLAGAETEMNSIPSRDLVLKKILQKIDGFDFVLIDCPPSLGVLTLNALIASNEVYVPMQAELLPYKGLAKLSDVLALIREMSDSTIDISGILLTMTQGTVLNRDIINILKEQYGDRVFSSMIRRNIAISEAITQKKSIFEYAPESNGAKDYSEFVNLVLSKSINHVNV